MGIWLDTTDLTAEQTVETILAQTPPVASPTVVTDYDQTWPARFTQVAQPVRDAVADLAAARLTESGPQSPFSRRTQVAAPLIPLDGAA